MIQLGKSKGFIRSQSHAKYSCFHGAPGQNLCIFGGRREENSRQGLLALLCLLHTTFPPANFGKHAVSYHKFTRQHSTTLHTEMSAISCNNFAILGGEIMGFCGNYEGERFSRCFCSWFGLQPMMCAIIWSNLVSSKWVKRLHNCHPKHLLWAMLFLKCGSSEDVRALQVGADRKTVRKWVWFVVEGIASLDRTIVSVNYIF